MLPSGVEEIIHTQTMLDTAMAVLYLLRAWRSMMYSIRRYAGNNNNESDCILQSSMKSTKVLNPRRCIIRVYTREIRMRVHEKYACSTDTHAVRFSETVNTRASYSGR